MKGFTLIETLLSLLIFGIISAALLVVFSKGKETYTTSMAVLDLQASGRLAMNALCRELRQSDTMNLTISNGNSRVDFQVPIDITVSPPTMSQNIAYYVANNQMIREHPAGTSRVVGNDIAQVQFNLTANRLAITLQLNKIVKQRVHTLTLEKQVLLRN